MSLSRYILAREGKEGGGKSSFRLSNAQGDSDDKGRKEFELLEVVPYNELESLPITYTVCITGHKTCDTQIVSDTY